MEIANIDGEIVRIFWTTWGNEMKKSLAYKKKCV